MSAGSIYLDWTFQGLGGLQDLYRLMKTKAFFGKIVSLLTGHSRSLLNLTTEVSRRKVSGQHYAGIRMVPISQIKGSESQLDDFDCDFNPMNIRTVDRWISVAVAHTDGMILPPVELIQLGEDYFVRDGHHRISVARAFHEEYVDAEVTVLELEPVSRPISVRVMANTLHG